MCGLHAGAPHPVWLCAVHKREGCCGFGGIHSVEPRRQPKLAPKPLGGCISASAAPRADVEPGRLKLHAKLSQLMVLGLHQIAVTLWLL